MQTLEKTDLPIHWVTKLFEVLQARYLNKFTSSISGIEENAVKEWSKGLAGLTNEQLKNGVDTWDSEWPPTLKEFRDRCLNKDLEEIKNLHKDYIRSQFVTKCKNNKCFISEINKILKG